MQYAKHGVTSLLTALCLLPGHFDLPVVILVTIMFLTISSVLWKAAKNNPVGALKY